MRPCLSSAARYQASVSADAMPDRPMGSKTLPPVSTPTPSLRREAVAVSQSGRGWRQMELAAEASGGALREGPWCWAGFGAHVRDRHAQRRRRRRRAADDLGRRREGGRGREESQSHGRRCPISSAEIRVTDFDGGISDARCHAIEDKRRWGALVAQSSLTVVCPRGNFTPERDAHGHAGLPRARVRFVLSAG